MSLEQCAKKAEKLLQLTITQAQEALVEVHNVLALIEKENGQGLPIPPRRPMVNKNVKPDTIPDGYVWSDMYGLYPASGGRPRC